MNVPLRSNDRFARISCAATAAPGGAVSKPNDTRHERIHIIAARLRAGSRPKV